MRLKRTLLWLALACLAMAAPAHAADWDRGSIKDRGGVPVPAPIPVTEHFRWYVRADIGIGLGEAPDVTESGLLYGEADSIAPFGIGSTWFNKDFDTFFTGGAGVGLYFTPHLRGDITVDARSANDVKVDQDFSYTQYDVATGVVTGNTVTGHTWEQTQVRGVVTLANLYWDLMPRGAGLTPYVGVGAGFVVRSMDRRHFSSQETVDGTGAVVGATSWSGQSKAHQVAPAAAAMAGLAWSLSPGTVIDIGYRFTWLGSVDMSTPINGYNSRITIGDSIDHEIRAGLRWNVW
jgi:opacity protein-like surface antigen